MISIYEEFFDSSVTIGSNVYTLTLVSFDIVSAAFVEYCGSTHIALTSA